MQYGVGYGRIVLLKWPFVDLTIDLVVWNWILESGKHGLIQIQILWIESETILATKNKRFFK